MPTTLETQLAAAIDRADAMFDSQRTQKLIRRFWQSDRRSDFAAFRQTAALAADELRTLGLSNVEIVDTPADGRTRMQGWIMPLGWEAAEATLRIVAPHEEVLCDRSVEPLSSVMWSEPTPPGGVRGPLVVVDDPTAVSDEDRAHLRGAFILTALPGPGPMKAFACQVGAAALVSQFVPHAERHPEALGWTNGWCDEPGGWALQAHHGRMTGFNVTPPAGRRLRELLSRGPVTCEARVGGRIGEGPLPVVTGVVPGESDEEVLLTGHLYEIGVHDNAAGCGTMVEAMRHVLALPRRRRSVRVLLTSECYGTYAFYTMRPELRRRTLTGINLDGVGETERPERPVRWQRTSEAGPGPIDTLLRAALRLTEHLPGALPWRETEHGMADTMLADPAAGAPFAGMVQATYHWHCTRDNWDVLDPRSLRRHAVAAIAATTWLAEAGPEAADALAEQVLADADAGVFPARDLPEDRRAFLLDRARQRVLWTGRLGAERAASAAERLPAFDFGALAAKMTAGGNDDRAEASRTVATKHFWGAPTFDGIGVDQRDGLEDPRWDPPRVTATYWIDSRRTVAEIAELVRLEFGEAPSAGELLQLLRVLAGNGLVTLRKD